MSHFTVMVIGFNAEVQLARFDANLSVPEYLRHKVSDEDKQRMLDYYKEEKGLAYPSFDECYAAQGESWNGNQYRKDENGVWCEYSTYNPDSKWDWYSLGGRWSGFFKLKPGKKGVKGHPEECDQVPGIDRAFKKDIDFEAMYAEAAENGRNRYREVAKACGGVIPKLEIPAPDRRNDLPADADYKALWDEYYAQESVKLFREKVSDHPFGPELDDFQCTEEEYVKREENGAVSTFAYLINGQWNERGSMGWFGQVDSPKSLEEWYKHMREMVDALPGDTLISIYDCHI